VATTDITQFLASKIANHIFGDDTMAKFTTLALALLKSKPANNITGDLTSIELPNILNYSRQTLNPGDANWDEAGNVPAIIFGPAANPGWENAIAVGITDNATHGAGNLLFSFQHLSPGVLNPKMSGESLKSSETLRIEFRGIVFKTGGGFVGAVFLPFVIAPQHNSLYLHGQLINHIFRTATFAKPTELAVALCKKFIFFEDTVATMEEVANSNNYARAPLNPGTANWDITTDIITHHVEYFGPIFPGRFRGEDVEVVTVLNKKDIVFNNPTGLWGQIRSVAIVDSATHGAGNILFFKHLPPTSVLGIANGDVCKIDKNNLKINII